MRLLFAAGLMAFAAACSPAAPAGPTAEDVAAESQKLTAYLNAEFEEELAMNPMMLTSMGRKELYGQLGDFSEGDAEKQLVWRRESVAGMKAWVYDKVRWFPQQMEKLQVKVRKEGSSV